MGINHSYILFWLSVHYNHVSRLSTVFTQNWLVLNTMIPDSKTTKETICSWHLTLLEAWHVKTKTFKVRHCIDHFSCFWDKLSDKKRTQGKKYTFRVCNLPGKKKACGLHGGRNLWHEFLSSKQNWKERAHFLFPFHSVKNSSWLEALMS